MWDFIDIKSFIWTRFPIWHVFYIFFNICTDWWVLRKWDSFHLIFRYFWSIKHCHRDSSRFIPLRIVNLWLWDCSSRCTCLHEALFIHLEEGSLWCCYFMWRMMMLYHKPHVILELHAFRKVLFMHRELASFRGSLILTLFRDDLFIFHDKDNFVFTQIFVCEHYGLISEKDGSSKKKWVLLENLLR